MMIELATVFCVIVIGAVFLLASGLRGASLAPLSLVAGLAIYILITGLLLAVGLPTSPVVSLPTALGIAFACLIYTRSKDRSGLPSPTLPSAILSGVGVVALLAWVSAIRAMHSVVIHPDSYAYVMIGTLLFRNETGVASATLLQTRLIAAPALLAPANATAGSYLPSLAPLLGIATLGIVYWLASTGSRKLALPRGQSLLVAVLAVALLLSNGRFLFHSVYLNAHLLFAAFLIVAAGGGWLLAISPKGDDSRQLASLIGVATAALVFVRPEGWLVAGLALVPLIGHRDIPVRSRAGVLASYGAAVVVWHGTLASRFASDTSVPLEVVVALAAGAACLVGALALLRKPQLVPSAAPHAIEGGLWLAFMGLALNDPGVVKRSFDATIENLVFGWGSWGVSFLVLSILGGIVLLATKTQERIFLRYPLTTFVPLSAALAVLREGAYRVGSQDSLNRMLMHVVPLLVLFVASGAASRSLDVWRPGQSRAAREEGAQSVG